MKIESILKKAGDSGTKKKIGIPQETSEANLAKKMQKKEEGISGMENIVE